MTPYQTAVLANSPIVFYEMQEASGTTATDSSGNSLNGTYTGTLAYQAPGPDSGTSYSIVPSSNGYLTPNAAVLAYLNSTGHPWTIEMLVNPKSVLSTLGLWGTGDVTSTKEGIDCTIDQFGCYFRVGDGSFYSFTQSTPLLVGSWNHLVAIFDGTNLQFYLNNVLFAVSPRSLSMPVTAFEVMNLGLSGSTPVDPATTCRFAYFAFYEQALGIRQVNNHYTALPQLTPVGGSLLIDAIANDNPCALYKMDETSGTTAADSSFLNDWPGTYNTGVTLHQSPPEISSADFEVGLSGSSSGVQAGVWLNPAQFSIESYISAASLPGSGQVAIFCNADGSTAVGMQVTADAGNVYFNVYGSDGATIYACIYPNALDSDTHQVIGTFDGQRARLYFDGQIVDQCDGPALGMLQTSGLVTVSAPYLGQSSSGQYFDGSVYYYAVYNYALTPAQVSAHYSAFIAVMSGSDSDSMITTGTDTNQETSGSSGPTFGSAMVPGSLYKTMSVFVGLQGLQGTAQGEFGENAYVQRGVYLLSSTQSTIEKGQIKTTGHAYDVARRFGFEVYDDFPKTLYGNQNDVRHDPAYDLTNPSGDKKTYISDAKVFMTEDTDNLFFQADYDQLFGSNTSNDGINVYIGGPGSPGTTPINPNLYVWHPLQGIVTFKEAIDLIVPGLSSYNVSLDGVPLGMAPELMMYHLFVGKANFPASQLLLQVSNLILPRYMGSYNSDTCWQVGQNIAKQTAPRGVSWQLRSDEYGNIQFYERKDATSPVITLEDERDLWTIEHTITDDNIVNVVRANTEAYNQQEINSLSYDLDSINEYGERQEEWVDDSILAPCRGMTPTEALAFCNQYAQSELYSKSRPIQQLKVTMAPNPNLEIGDKVSISERRTGITGPYIIRGITEKIEKGQYTYEARLDQCRIGANFGYGFPSQVARYSGQDDTTIDQSAAISGGQHAIISGVRINETDAILGGSQVYDSGGNPVIPIVTSLPFSLSLKLSTERVAPTWIWRYLYFECPNTLSSTDLMVGRLAAWSEHDAKQISVTTIEAGNWITNQWHSMNSSSFGGTGVVGLTYLYSNLVVGVSSRTIPPGYNYKSVSLYFNGDYSKVPTQLGVGWGPAHSTSFGWCPTQKHTYGYFCVFAVNKAGAMQFCRVPLVLEI